MKLHLLVMFLLPCMQAAPTNQRRTDYSWITTPTPECYDGTTSYELTQTCNGR